jgi:hypothetical protein
VNSTSLLVARQVFRRVLKPIESLSDLSVYLLDEGPYFNSLPYCWDDNDLHRHQDPPTATLSCQRRLVDSGTRGHHSPSEAQVSMDSIVAVKACGSGTTISGLPALVIRLDDQTGSMEDLLAFKGICEDGLLQRPRLGEHPALA